MTIHVAKGGVTEAFLEPLPPEEMSAWGHEP